MTILCAFFRSMSCTAKLIGFRPSVILLLVVAVRICAAPQDGEPQPTFRTGVERVLVPVVVRDGAGTSVRDLQLEHFRIYDEGEIRPITDFSFESHEVSAQANRTVDAGVTAESGSAARGASQRFIHYLFDDRHISFQDLEHARSAFETHLASAAETDTRAAVVATSGQVFTTFTSDRELLTQAARLIKPGHATATGLGCPEISYYMADLIVNRRDPSALNAAFKQLIRCGPPVPQKPGEMIVRNEATRILQVGSAQTLATLKVLETVLERLSAVRGRREIIVLSAGFSLVRERAEYERILARAVEAGVVINAINAHGVHLDGVDASNHLPSARYTSEAFRSVSDTLSLMAETTGGRYAANANDIGMQLRELTQQPEIVYTLAFAPGSGARPGAFRKLRVEVTGIKNVSVQARRGYFAPHPRQTREVRELIRAAMTSPHDVNEISLRVNAAFHDGNPGLTLKVHARIGATGLKFRKCQDHVCNALTVVYGLFDGNGGYIGEVTRKADLRLNAPALERFQKLGIQLAADFTVPRGSYSARVVVIDEEDRRVAAVERAVSP